MNTYKVVDINEEEIIKKYDVDSLVAKLLEASNINEEDIIDILSDDMELDTSKAECVLYCVDRIKKAKENKEKIFVGGDYDADGICATAIMKKTLDLLDIENGYYIPDRFTEGYGLHPETVTLAYEKGYSLILTVDNGVKAFDAINKAKELGVDIIITDHHIIEDELDVPVVHPNYMEEQFQYLSGAGVVLEISRNLIGDNDELTALAGVAQIADVMKMYKETRKLAKKGLEILKEHKPLSLYSLLNNDVSYRSIAFDIVPKLNCVGRLNEYANVNTVPQFLISENEKDIMYFSTQIAEVNELRKSLSNQEVALAEKEINDDAFQIIYNPNFHEGICGLVAGRITSTIQKPTLILSKHDDLLKGSARSVPGLDLMEFFSDIPYIEMIGGHEMAAGIGIKEANLEAFKEAVLKKLETYHLEDISQENIAIKIKPSDISLEKVKELNKLEPMPKEIADLVFVLEDFEVLDVFRNQKITKYTIQCDNCQLEAIGFAYMDLPHIDKPKEIFGKLQINKWQDKETVQLQIEDIR